MLTLKILKNGRCGYDFLKLVCPRFCPCQTDGSAGANGTAGTKSGVTSRFFSSSARCSACVSLTFSLRSTFQIPTLSPGGATRTCLPARWTERARSPTKQPVLWCITKSRNPNFTPGDPKRDSPPSRRQPTADVPTGPTGRGSRRGLQPIHKGPCGCRCLSRPRNSTPGLHSLLHQLHQLI